MKKIIASAIIAAFAIVTVNVQAQTVAKEIKNEHRTEKKEQRKGEVSVQSKNQFLRDFDGVSNVRWVRGPQFEEATFIKDGVKTTAYYDYQSSLVGTTTDKKIADLPAKALKEIKKSYKDYVIGAVVLFDDNEANDTDMFFSGTQFEDADHYFVTVSKDKKEIILMVNTDGEVSYFKQLK